VNAIFESGHPTSLELASLLDGGDGDILGRGGAVRAHTADCRRCLAHLLTADDAIVTDFANQPPDVPTSQLPAVVLAALVRPSPSAVTRGEIWRLTWDELTALAVVTMTDEITATVVPVADPVEADEGAQIVSSDDSPLGAAVVFWPFAQVVVSLAAFDTHLGRVEVELPTELSTELEFPPIAAELRRIGDRSVAWMPTPSEERPHQTPPVVAALEERGLGFEELADAVGDEAALELWRDGRPPSREEVDALVRDLDVPTDVVAAEWTAPAPLLTLVCSPDYKIRVRRAAVRHGSSEAEVRTSLVDTILAPAARTTGLQPGTGDLGRWRALIDHELAR